MDIGGSVIDVYDTTRRAGAEDSAHFVSTRAQRHSGVEDFRSFSI